MLLSQSWSSDRPVLVAFVDPACGPCAGLLPHLATWTTVQQNRLAVTLISRGDVDANRAKYSGFGTLLLQNEWEVSLAYGALATPSALVIDANGIIGSPLATGVGQITELVAHTVSAPNTPSRSPAGLSLD